MDRLFVIAIAFCFTLVGFVMRLVEYRRIQRRIDTTYSYRNQFIDFVNALINNRNFNDEAYIWLTENINEMQAELETDGIIAYMYDPLRGVKRRNYQILINYLPKLRNFLSETSRLSSNIMTENYLKEAGFCDDAFIRHVGTLHSLEKSMHKQLINPLSSFSYGIENFLFIPVSALTAFGLLPTRWGKMFKHSKILKLLVGIVELVTLISSVVNVVLGWDEFSQIISRLLQKI